MQLVTNWNDTNYSDSLSANLEAARGQGSNEPLFMRPCLKWLLPSHGVGAAAAAPPDTAPHREGSGDRGTPPRPPWPDTSKVSPCQSVGGCCQAGHGLLGRNKCCIHPQGLPCTFNWRCDASWGTATKSKNRSACTRLTRKNKGLLFCETSQEKLKSNELSGVSSFKNIYGNSTVC